MARLEWQKRECQTLSSGRIPWTVLQTATPYPPYPPCPLPPKLPGRSCTHTVSQLLQCSSSCVFGWLWLKQSQVHKQCPWMCSPGLQHYHYCSNVAGCVYHVPRITGCLQLDPKRHCLLRSFVNMNRNGSDRCRRQGLCVHAGHRTGSALLHRSVDTADLVSRGMQPARNRYYMRF